MREQIFEYAKSKYETLPDSPWREYPDYAILRHSDDGKWYGLIMNLPKSKLGLGKNLSTPAMEFDRYTVERENHSSLASFAASLSSDQRLGNKAFSSGSRPASSWMEDVEEEDWIDVLNVKCDPDLIDLLRMNPGILPGYHMSRKYWISILLDGSVPFEQVTSLLDQSFQLTASPKELERFHMYPHKDWIIPANPKYYDVVKAFEESDVIGWKQGAGIHEGDTVYMYVAAPYSSLMYQCRVLETGLPYYGHNDKVNVKHLMNIQLERRFEPGLLSFEKLGEFGVRAVRGPRSMPRSLIEEIERL